MNEENQGYWGRLWGAVIGKQGPVEDTPEKPNHGAAWASAGGVRPAYSQTAALSALGIHAYVHAAAMRASQDLAALPLILIRGVGDKEEVIQSHEVLDLLAQPNSSTDGALFREQLAVDLMLPGNAYTLLLGAGEKPVSLVRLHPGETEIITTLNGLSGYQHRSSGQAVEYPPDRVVHLRNSTYSMGPQSLYGTGAIEALKFELTGDINAQKLASQASAQGRPDVILSPAEDGDIWPLAVRQEVADRYAGLAKSGGALVLSGAVKMETLNLTPRDLEFQAVRTMARESISAVMGVPGSVLGLPTANYATAKQQSEHYWSVQQKRGARLETLFTAVAKKWDTDFRVVHDYSGVAALQAVRGDQLLRIQMHIRLGADPAAAYSAEGLTQPSTVPQVDEDKSTADLVARLFSATQNKGDHLPVSVNPSNPWEQEEDDIERAILNTLGDNAPNWQRYQEAHLWSDPDRLQTRSGYRFRVARLYDDDDPENGIPSKGHLVVYRDLLARSVEELNGRDNGLMGDERERIYAKIKRYYAAMELDPAPLLDVLLGFGPEKKKSIGKASNPRDRIWWSWLRRVHNPTEKALYAVVRKYIRAAAKRYEKRIRDQVTESKGDIRIRTVMSWKELLAVAEEEREYIAAVGTTFARHWQLSGSAQLEEIGRQAGIDLAVPFSDRYLAGVAIGESAILITGTTGAAVKSIIETGLVDGLSIESMVEKMTKSGALSAGRATMIARTEATKAVNGGAVDAYRLAAEEGIQIKKQWLSARDDKVRPEHDELDGQEQGLEDDFVSISGDGADAPGGFGVAELDINCRCTVLPVVVR
ncbi:MAG TPA: phage portal protein [Myxococcales bacterium]|nr:phage portal protein [Myxococcales bacterium]